MEEALDALRRSHEDGLVHLAYVMKGEEEPKQICSCCPCCCHTLGGLLRRGIAASVLSSRFVAEDDPGACSGCGACVKRCVFEARTMQEDKPAYDASKCFGCGLCVSTCSTGAFGWLAAGRSPTRLI